jgi:hypothetical protein
MRLRFAPRNDMDMKLPRFARNDTFAFNFIIKRVT